MNTAFERYQALPGCNHCIFYLISCLSSTFVSWKGHPLLPWSMVCNSCGVTLLKSEGSAHALPLFLLSSRIIMLCNCSSTMTKLIYYGTKWLLYADVPLKAFTHSLMHVCVPLFIFRFLYVFSMSVFSPLFQVVFSFCNFG